MCDISEQFQGRKGREVLETKALLKPQTPLKHIYIYNNNNNTIQISSFDY